MYAVASGSWGFLGRPSLADSVTGTGALAGRPPPEGARVAFAHCRAREVRVTIRALGLVSRRPYGRRGRTLQRERRGTAVVVQGEPGAAARHRLAPSVSREPRSCPDLPGRVLRPAHEHRNTHAHRLRGGARGEPDDRLPDHREPLGVCRLQLPLCEQRPPGHRPSSTARSIRSVSRPSPAIFRDRFRARRSHRSRSSPRISGRRASMSALRSGSSGGARHSALRARWRDSS